MTPVSCCFIIYLTFSLVKRLNWEYPLSPFYSCTFLKKWLLCCFYFPCWFCLKWQGRCPGRVLRSNWGVAMALCPVVCLVLAWSLLIHEADGHLLSECRAGLVGGWEAADTAISSARLHTAVRLQVPPGPCGEQSARSAGKSGPDTRNAHSGS